MATNLNTKTINGLLYNTKEWDDVEWHTNCYAYALNLTVNPLTKKRFYDLSHCQPGNICGHNENYTPSENFTNVDIEKFLEDVKRDLKHIGMEIKPSTFDETEYNNEWWKVALCFSLGDYHWYRQNSDGTWSHKQGMTEVKRFDRSGNIINNPETCDRGAYTKFAGFFLIRKINKDITEKTLTPMQNKYLSKLRENEVLYNGIFSLSWYKMKEEDEYELGL